MKSRVILNLVPFVVFLLLLSACAQPPAPTPTSVPPPTATRVLPSPTPVPPAATPTRVPPTATAAPVATPTRVPSTVTTVPTAAPSTGTVEVRVTDAPPAGVTKVLVTASKIEAQRSGATEEAGWTTLVESPPVFDLVAVTDVEDILGTTTLPEGSYTQVRLAVTKVVVTVQGKDQDATVPSDRLRVVGTFQVAKGKVTVLTLDFDADKSVVLAGPNVQFKPVVKLLTREPAEKPEPLKGKVLTVPLLEVGGSGQSGTATLTAQGDKTEVVINIKAGAAGVAQPAHIHDKDCTTPGAVKYPLTNVVDGKSTTVVNATLASLQASAFAVRVHKSAPEIAIYVSCGEIPMKLTVAITEVGGSGQSGTATLTAQGDKTEVVINIKAGAAGVAQPAHIHDKDCTTPGAVKYPLTNVVDGKSTTVVNATLASLQASAFAVRVHKSAPEIATYVSCGEIPLAAVTTPAPTPTGTPATPTLAPTAQQASIANFRLPNITVPVGTKVTWTNNDSAPHTVSAGQNGRWDGKGFDSSTLQKGDSFNYTFSEVGTFSYTCKIHPSLNATVTVGPSGTTGTSTSPTPGTGGTDYDYAY